MTDEFFDVTGPGEFDAEPADSEGILRHLVDLVSTARGMPLSASVLLDRDEVVELLSTALDRLPDELRQSRWLLKERDELLAQARREADGLIEEGTARAAGMVQRTEIVRQANQVAQRILDDAREEARRLKHEAEDFCDQKLASFEIVLDRTMKTVQAGRGRLQATPAPVPGPSAEGLGEGGEALLPFFDQDET